MLRGGKGQYYQRGDFIGSQAASITSPSAAGGGLAQQVAGATAENASDIETAIVIQYAAGPAAITLAPRTELTTPPGRPSARAIPDARTDVAYTWSNPFSPIAACITKFPSNVQAQPAARNADCCIRASLGRSVDLARLPQNITQFLCKFRERRLRFRTLSQQSRDAVIKCPGGGSASPH